MSENQPAKMLRICAEDPMWADHAEVSKTLLLRAAAEIERLTAALAAAVAEPGAIHQWRTIGCADWYDGHPDHGDGGGPYETRTLYAAPPQREPQWVPVAERLPPSGQTVLACYMNRAGRMRRIRAEWIAAKSVESNSEHSDIGVYDEATDTFYDPEGWYERIDNWGDYSAVGVCEGDVTHWMPLPDAPASAPKEQA